MAGIECLPRELFSLIMEFWDPAAEFRRRDIPTPLCLEEASPKLAAAVARAFQSQYRPSPLEGAHLILRNPVGRLHFIDLLQRARFRGTFITPGSLERNTFTVRQLRTRREEFVHELCDYRQRSSDLAAAAAPARALFPPERGSWRAAFQTALMTRAYMVCEANALWRTVAWAGDQTHLNTISGAAFATWKGINTTAVETALHLRTVRHSFSFLLGNPFAELPVHASTTVLRQNAHREPYPPPLAGEHFCLTFSTPHLLRHFMTALHLSRVGTTLAVVCEMNEEGLGMAHDPQLHWSPTWNWLAILGILLPLWRAESWSTKLEIRLPATVYQDLRYEAPYPAWLLSAVGFCSSALARFPHAVAPQRAGPAQWREFQRRGALPNCLYTELLTRQRYVLFTVDRKSYRPPTFTERFPSLEETQAAAFKGQVLVPRSAWTTPFLPWETLGSVGMLLHHPGVLARLFMEFSHLHL